MIRQMVSFALVALLGVAGYWILSVRDVLQMSDASTPFEVAVLFDGTTINIRSAQGNSWSVTSTLSAEQEGPIYFVAGRVAGRVEDLPPDGYCFAVELVDGKIHLKAVRGVNWGAASFGCGGSETCRFIISESGVRSS